MNANSYSGFAAIVLLAASVSTAAAGDLKFMAEAGAARDSNAGIAELDQNSNAADNTTHLRAGLGYDRRFGAKWQVGGGYEYASTRYRRFREFDLALHRLHAGGSWTRGGTVVAVNVDHFDGALDNAEYIEFLQLAPSLSQLIGERLFVRLAWLDGEKRFATVPGRDAATGTLRMDAYWLIDGMQHYVALTLQDGNEDAVDSTHDFDVAAVGLTWGTEIGLPRTRLQLKSQLAHETRDYAIEPATGSARHDDRWRGRFSATIPFNEVLSLEGSVEYTDVRSTLQSADHSRVVAGVKLVLRF